MLDYQTLGLIVGAVAVVAIVLYVWDRTTKSQPIEVVDAGKLAIGAGAIAGGVAYAVGTEDVTAVAETVVTAAQDMFVGKPEF